MSSLRKVLELPTVVSTSAGLAYAAVNFLALVQVALLMAGESAWLAIVAAGLLCLPVAAVFGELAGTLPSAAGIRVWTRQGIGDSFSLFFTLFYLATVLLVIAADSFILAEAVAAGIPTVPGILWIYLFLTASYLANRQGVRLAGLVQDATTYTLLASLVVISVAALLHHPQPIHQPFAVLAGNPLQAIAVAVFVFVGFEWVTPLAEEIRDEGTNIPRGMFLAVGALAVSFALFTLTMTHLIRPSALARSLTPQLAVGQAAFGAVGFWWMLLVTLITALTTFNGSFVSASRLLYAMSRERTLPPALAQLNRHFVPERALTALFLVSLVLATLVYLTRAYQILIDAGAALEAAMYVVASLALLGIRRRRPELLRRFRAPGGSFLPWGTAVVFFVLFLGAVTAPVPPPHGRPWAALLLLFLAGLALFYTYAVAPRLRARGRSS